MKDSESTKRKSDLKHGTILASVMARLEKALVHRGEILFAYLHGSALFSEGHQDIDIAVFLDAAEYGRLESRGDTSLDYSIPLEMELERLLGERVDLQILNQAPLGFQYRVISQGKLVADRNPGLRADFESLCRVKFHDFRPKREEYLREALT